MSPYPTIPHTPAEPAQPAASVVSGVAVPLEGTEYEAPPTKRSAKPLLISAGAFVVVLALGVGAFFVVGTRKAHALTVTLEPLNSRTAGAFTASVVSVSTNDAAAFGKHSHSGTSGTKTVFSTQSRQGNANGIFGISATKPVCNTSRLASLVESNTNARAAWAAAVGTSIANIDRTIQSLTPVLLSQDTAATEVFYINGGAVARQVVLQAGTAVLINQYGALKVRCASGDPLQAAQHTTNAPTVSGAKWPNFNPSNIVTIQPTPKPITSIPAHDIQTNKPISADLGGTVNLNGYLVSDDKGVSVVSLDGKRRTTVINHPVASAFDDGMGGIIYQDLHTGALVDSGNDYPSPMASPRTVEDRLPAKVDEATIWHLPAGQKNPVALVSPGSDLTSWPIIDAVSMLGGHGVVAYQQLSTTSSQLNGTPVSLHVIDLNNGSDKIVDNAVGVYESGLNGVSISNKSFTYWVYAEGMETWHTLNASLKEGPSPCAEASDPTNQNDPCHNPIAILTDGTLLARNVSTDGSDNGLAIANPATDTVITPIANSAIAPCPDVCPESYIEGDINGMQFISSDVTYADNQILSSDVRLFDLVKNTSTTLDINGVVRFIRSPIIRPRSSIDQNASTTSSTSTPTTVPAPTTLPAPPTTPIQSAQSTCDISHLAIAVQNNEGFDPRTVSVPGVSGLTGIEELKCVGDWALAGVDHQDVGPEDNNTLFHYQSGTWVEIGNAGYPGPDCKLIAMGAPEDVAIQLSPTSGDAERQACSDLGLPSTQD